MRACQNLWGDRHVHIPQWMDALHAHEVAVSKESLDATRLELERRESHVL
jgi:hypothetical protein